jgi:carbonic anhydrase
MISAQEALDRLRSGNQRFIADECEGNAIASKAHRIALEKGQEPFAIILGCADSRVPAEIVFDQGLGDLFVIRVAGNVVAPSQIGSIEFAAERFGTQLVIVLGHTSCGAVAATIEELERPSQNRSPNLHAIVSRIEPTVASMMATKNSLSEAEFLDEAVRANIRASVKNLRNGSGILEQLIQSGKLVIVGAEYSLETGEVEFLD